ncbi:MAG: hypothetical protein U5R14_03350 [Gemmatimonadota bacterium]|nr:hypothetical protein [Gemmatimonadota bacterium]
MIDPEALVLASLCFREQERRLGDLVSWWAHAGANLTSVHRLRTLSGRFPAGSGPDAFEQFARLALDAGDRRWEGHATPSVSWVSRSGKGPGELALVHPSTLWLRLRAGFGVGAKADAFAFLLGLRGARASVKVISSATGYSDVSIRKAVSEMALAGLVRETRGRPAEYFTPSRDWARALSLHSPGKDPDTDPEVPRWRCWAELYAYLAHVAEWSRLQDSQVPNSPRVLASKARDILEQFRRPFTFNEIPVPDPTRFRGPEIVHCLAETTAILSDWLKNHL